MSHYTDFGQQAQPDQPLPRELQQVTDVDLLLPPAYEGLDLNFYECRPRPLAPRAPSLYDNDWISRYGNP